MKVFLKILLIFVFYSSSVLAETLNAALKRAYETNPELNAEREGINISEQELKVSRSSYLPTITIEGSKSDEDTDKLMDCDEEIIETPKIKHNITGKKINSVEVLVRVATDNQNQN